MNASKQRLAATCGAIVMGVCAFLLPRLPVEEQTVSSAAIEKRHQAEGFRAGPYIPTQGDVPTIGYGSTVYEDGTRVTLADPPITRERAVQIARAHTSKAERMFRASIPGVELYPGEYDLYMDFIYQFGINTWTKGSLPGLLKAGRYTAACQKLLEYRFQGGRDCSLSKNWGPRGCRGVWLRQQERHSECMALQGAS